MDNLTHTLTGYLLSRAGLNRVTPQATAVLLVAANIPDCDAVSGLYGSVAYLHWHRYLTHSVLFLPVMAALPVLLAWMFGRWRDGTTGALQRVLRWFAGGPGRLRGGRAYLVAAIGVASHLLLDFTNIYGIRLLAPWSSRWFRMDSAFVVDPWIWALFLFAIGAPLLGQLVSSEIGASSSRGRGWAIFALCTYGLYIGGRYLLHQHVVEMAEARVYQGAPPRQITAVPTPANPLRWELVVETEGFYSIQDVLLTREFDPSAGRIFYKAELSQALLAARRTPEFHEFEYFNGVPLWQVTPLTDPPNGRRVQLFDLRFGNPVRPGFVSTAVVDGANHVVEAEFHFARLPR